MAMESYPFFIELRLGYVDPKLRLIIRDVKDRFRLGKECHQVPHLTLFGPFNFKSGYNLKDVQRIIEKAAGNIYEIPFTIKGWDEKKTPHGRVIAFKVDPSKELSTLHRQLQASLCPITFSKNQWDCTSRDPWFHVTLAMHLSDQMYRSVMTYVGGADQRTRNLSPSLWSRLFALFFGRHQRDGRNGNPLYLPATGLRITVLNQKMILKEYDLLQKRWLSRQESISGREYARTLSFYRKYRGIELSTPGHSPGPTEFVVSDLHLGHRNIIRYCARPFSTKDVDEMDEVLIRNWNHRVKPDDTVYFLGDLAVGEKTAMGYQRRLNGTITYIKGNHDEHLPNARNDLFLQYAGIDFRLIHDPKARVGSSEFDGWTIHGHAHNNDLRRYPFFDPIKRKINVSVELVDYQPVSLSFVCHLIKTRSEPIWTIREC